MSVDPKPELKELLLREHLVDPEAMDDADRVARRDGLSLVESLVDQGTIAEDALADVLARAIDGIVIDVDLGALDRESVRLIPPEVARRHLMVPVAQATNVEVLRVAFANPLDAEAVACAREFSGLEVEPMVATLSAIRAVLDREYRVVTTDVIRAQRTTKRPEFQGEVTRQISPPERRAGPSPTYRLGEEATIEQRHEALLLALVEAGVLTRADYLAALKRLAGRSRDS
ncbi:MAG: hypothetical protein AAGF12_03470 [Myxococcota bacterium]